MKALIIDNVSKKIAAALTNRGIEVTTLVMPGAEQLAQIICEYDILIMRVLPPIDKYILDAAKKLKLIAVCSVGTAHIDLAYAQKKGISVINAPGASANSVAELAVCKMLELSRHTIQAHTEVVNDRIWEKNHFAGHELRGRTLGLVGFGRIGRRIGQIAKAFEMRVIAYDPYLTSEQCANAGAEKMEKPKFLQTADIISIQLPLTPETNNLISFEDIEQMRKGTIVINMSRGGVLNEEAAAEGLKSGKLGGIGVDVLKEELADISSDAVLFSPLFEIEGNCAVTPHIGACTAEAQDAIGEIIAEQIMSFFTH